MDEFEFFNRCYLKTREDGAIVDAWSDGPLRDKPTEGAVCFNDKGGYQLRLKPFCLANFKTRWCGE